MFAIIGILVLIAMVFGGFALTGGNLGPVMHALPHEMLIIGGAAIGSLIIGNSGKELKALGGGLSKVFKGPRFGKQDYLDCILLVGKLMKLLRTEGPVALEPHIENPKESALFAEYPKLLADQTLIHLICDTLRLVVVSSGTLDPHAVEKGSFTGAHCRRTGHFENAHKGTLFLDEIGDMRFDMQVKLLRVLEERVVTRVGSSQGTAVDVRIVSATHQDMDSAMADGRFRQDLFFRLGVVLVHVPSLAERCEDIPLLIRHFQKGKPSGAIAHFDEGALERLMAHGWPGNVRELRNVVERAGVLYGGEILNAKDVDLLLTNALPPLESRQERMAAAPKSFVPVGPAPSKEQPIDLRQEIETIELERINMALELADGIVSEAARLLTLKRTTLIEKMRKYGVQALA